MSTADIVKRFCILGIAALAVVAGLTWLDGRRSPKRAEPPPMLTTGSTMAVLSITPPRAIASVGTDGTVVVDWGATELCAARHGVPSTAGDGCDRTAAALSRALIAVRDGTALRGPVQ